jgi:hypothetical protein
MAAHAHARHWLRVPGAISGWVTLRARWVTLRARWVTLRARWVTLRARWGDAKSSLGDAKSSLGDAERSLGDAFRCIDVELVSKMCHAADCIVCIDGTFATPINQRALSQGADLVLHSATKYIAGAWAPTRQLPFP